MNLDNTLYNDDSVELTLCRYPAKSQHKSLQAWDSADQLIIAHLRENPMPQAAKVAVFNDEFGALTALLSTLPSTPSIHAYSDSWISHLATKDNLQRNNLHPDYALQDSLTTPIQTDSVLLKIPRSMALLEYQLQRIQQAMPADTPIIASAKLTALTPSVFKLFEYYCGSVTTSLARKKSRLLFATTQQETPAKNQFPTTFNTSANETHAPLTLLNHANVFSRQSLDIGARVMLHHLPQFDANSSAHILDLGCGNGVLGLSMLAQYPTLRVTFVDESFMAVASAKAAVKHNMPDALPRCQFLVSNCLEQYDTATMGDVDCVLCNPPFHQQNTVTEHIARQMFYDAHRVLSNGGELRVVANRHLPYGKTLKQRFGGFAVLASERKFVILSAQKRR